MMIVIRSLLFLQCLLTGCILQISQYSCCSWIFSPLHAYVSAVFKTGQVVSLGSTRPEQGQNFFLFLTDSIPARFQDYTAAFSCDSLQSPQSFCSVLSKSIPILYLHIWLLLTCSTLYLSFFTCHLAHRVSHMVAGSGKYLTCYDKIRTEIWMLLS